MQNSSKIFRLEGVVQHYAWGGKTFIPGLIHHENVDSKPFAEYWLGAHDNAPATIISANDSQKLNELISKNPAGTIGERVAHDFKRLPYLLKILDVKDMLSIQVHPDKQSAEEAYEEENKKGIPVTAGNRNYKDANHKPELMLALSDFWLLHGFKSPEKLSAIFQRTPELNFLSNVFETGGYKALYQTVMQMPQQEVNAVLQPLIDRIVPLYKTNGLTKDQEDFWAARASLTYNQDANIDRGIFSVYFFNIVHCKPGEAVFQDAGVPHAYLEGQNVEIMANSDNVLRGGLTPKYIDVPELMKHVKFEGMIPKIITGRRRGDVEEVYETPAPDFELSHFSLADNQTTGFTSTTADIVFVDKGVVNISDEHTNLCLKSGEAGIIFSDTRVEIYAQQEASMYRASVPV